MSIINNVLKLITQGGGTVNAITATFTPAIPADSQCMVIVRSTGVNNSTTVTLQLNDWSAYPCRARGNNALRLSDTGLAGYEMIWVFNTTGLYWELLNPATSTILEATTIAAADATSKANAALASANAYTDSVVVGLWDDRGNYDASVNAYPSAGGSGPSGEVRKGDTWTISVAGTLPTGQVVEIGDVVRALVDDATNTQADWAIQQNNIGYTAENSANKKTSMTGNESSNVFYLSAKAVYDWVIALGWLTAQIWGTWISSLTDKPTPVDADYVTIMDSEDTNKAKKISWSNLKATLKTYFDTQYVAQSVKLGWSALTPAASTTYRPSPLLVPSAASTVAGTQYQFKTLRAVTKFNIHVSSARGNAPVTTGLVTIKLNNITQSTTVTVGTLDLLTNNIELNAWSATLNSAANDLLELAFECGAWSSAPTNWRIGADITF